jgi:hypothetical protein
LCLEPLARIPFGNSIASPVVALGEVVGGLAIATYGTCAILMQQRSSDGDTTT